ncbi:MAG: HypC/HybG/HupF family hydrogenase formation chaperone [Bacteroidales bacterium]|nr:HypC/HybG/HupF family hydrogenase formation chaperone [Bacteroidales bacterium]MBN2763103.1 HypC/HybG/HupF family hydrogenase formation chaperone [Bacteroidales bacterium]
MCLSIPARVVSVDGNTARVSVGGTLVNVALHLVDDVTPGDYVLVHTGFALQKVSEEEALETIELIRQLNAAGEEKEE